MRQIVFLLIFGLNMSYALNSYSQSTVLTINMRNKAIGEVFSEIEKKSEFFFFYMEEDMSMDLNKKITIRVKDKNIETILDNLFGSTDIEYMISDRQIALSKRIKDEVSEVSEPSEEEQAIIQPGILVTGTVTDEVGEPLPGVNVIVKGTTTGTVTDIDGKYRINVPNTAAELTFTFVGYSEQTISVGDQIIINVTLIEGAVAIQEVEVIGIGYGNIRRRDVTGALDVADIKEMQKTTSGSTLDALAGRISGVQIISPDGTPGQGSHVVIRGGNSITGDNNPLYVVDGFPMHDDFDLGMLDPSEIENLVVLKDASSTAIYGSRGANGVIMVTTKRGSVSRKPQITYRGVYGTETVTNRMDMMTPYEFVAMELERQRTGRYGGLFLEDYIDMPGIDWQGMLFRRVWQHTHTLSVRGGTEQTKYNFTGGYRDQDGVVITTNYKRYNIKLDLDQELTKWLKSGISLGYIRDVYTGQQLSTYSGAESDMHFYTMYACWAYRPVLISPDGEMLSELDLFDPEAASLQLINPILNLYNIHAKNFRNWLNVNAYLDFKITEHLSFKTIARIDQYSSSREEFNNSRTQSGFVRSRRQVNGSIYNDESLNRVNENILTWRKTVRGKYSFTGTGAVTFEKFNYQNYGYATTHIPSEQQGMAALNRGNILTMQSSIDPGTQRVSFLGRIIFDYRSKYLTTFSMRADGSSRFAKGNRWGYFPSASVGWVFTQEEFMKSQNILSNGKLRASYGWTGNDRINSSARYQQMVYGDLYRYPANYEWQPAAYISYPGNENLKWERTEQTNIGVDLGFLKNRIALKADVYRKNTRDLLLDRSLPAMTGFTRLMQNVGKVQNQGVEITINTVNMKRSSFEWRTDFNIAANENKIVALADGQPSILTTLRVDDLLNAQPPYIARIGKPVGSFYGLVWDGVYQLDDFIYSDTGIPMAKTDVPAYTGSVRPGDVKYQDVNGDGVIDAYDRQIIGRATPLFFGGMNNSFAYKGFDLSIFFRWSYGNQVLNANRLGMENGFRQNTNQFRTFVNRWSPDNQDTDMQRVGANGTYYYSSRVIEDASFLRLQSVTLGYSIPKEWLNKVSFDSARLSLAMNNLWTWTNYSGFDPEISSRHSALTPSFDFSSYARARTIALTLNASF